MNLGSINIELRELENFYICAFRPGSLLFFQFDFDETEIDKKYIIRICDAEKNVRLNKYGKVIERQVTMNWRVPFCNQYGKWIIELDFQDGTIEKFYFYVENKNCGDNVNLQSTFYPAVPEMIPYLANVNEDMYVSVEEEAPDLEKPEIDEKVELTEPEEERIISETPEEIEVEEIIIPVVEIKEETPVESTEIVEKIPIDSTESEVEIEEKVPVESTEPEIEPVVGQPVVSVPGIGKKTAEKLNTINIYTVEGLAEVTVSLLSTIGISKNRAEKWIKVASKMMNKPIVEEALEEPEKDYELVDLKGLGVKTSEKLKAVGIVSLLTLSKETDLNEIAEKSGLSIKKLEKWQKESQSLIAEL